MSVCLKNAVRVQDGAFWEQAARIRTHLNYQPDTFSDSTQMVREDRDVSCDHCTGKGTMIVEPKGYLAHECNDL